MTAWLIALTSWIHGELGVRLVFVLLMQGAGFLLTRLVPAPNRWFVWASLGIFPLLAFAGVFAIPDAPLVIFSCAWLYVLKRSLERDNWADAVLMGVVTAMLLYSKYHGVLFIAGTLLALPRLLLRPTFWLSALVGLACYLPHVHWQWAHDFATFQYHFVDRPRVALGWKQPLEFTLLQLILPGLFLAPLMWKNFFLSDRRSEFARALFVLALFVPGFFFLSTFSKQMEANWTVAAGIPLLLLVSMGPLGWMQSRSARALLGLSVALVLVARLLLIMPPEWHQLDRSGEFHGWREYADKVAKEAGDCPLAANRYQIASKLSFYLQREIPALNVRTRLNQFEFWDWQKAYEGREVCWLTDKTKLFPGGVRLVAPDGKKLVLVKGVPLSDILSHKKQSL